MAQAEYVITAELPDLEILWRDHHGNIVDFSGVNWTFTLKVGVDKAAAALITKTLGITGAATDPNVIVSWDAGELEPLSPPGTYLAELKALRNDGKSREMKFSLVTRWSAFAH